MTSGPALERTSEDKLDMARMLVLPTEQVADQINQREEQMRREADTKITIHRGRHAGMETWRP